MLSSRRSFGLVVLALGFFSGAASLAQESPTQVLDRVNAVTPRAILEMAFDDPAGVSPFYPFDDPPAITTTKGFSACQLTATKGLFCLDQNAAGNPGRSVRKWDPVTATGEQGTATVPYFSCEDAALGLDISRGTESCTGITADDKGGVVIAGKRKGGYNLIKVVSTVDSGISCTSTSEPWKRMASNPGLCRKVLLPRDRPLLVDITYTKLTLPGALTCTGIIGLESRTALMFFKDPDVVEASCVLDPLEIAASKSWGLAAKEVLQAATVLKFPDGGNSFALVVSSGGRVFAKQTDAASAVSFPVQLFHASGTGPHSSLAALRNSRGGTLDLACSTASAQKYGVRTSTKSGSLYVTDQNFCEVTSLKPAGSTLSSLVGLKVTEFPVPSGLDLVLATKLATTSYPPLEPTLAPGISVDLSKCAGTTGCTLVADSSGGQAATLSEVSLASTKKGMTLFQIKNIPDCRWILADPTVPDPAACTSDVVSPTGVPPEKQFLNIAKLLPKEVTEQFPPGFFDTRPMYLSPEYRAQITAYLAHPADYYFDAFFFVPQSGVFWKDVFTLELDVGALTGSELGCNASYSANSGIPVLTLLKWDIATTISEFVQVVGGPSSGLSYTDIFINTGCGTTITRPPRGSAFPYNLELTPTVYTHTLTLAAPPEDFFAHVVVDLFYDLRYAQAQTACQSGGPLTSIGTVCSSLTSSWNSARDKLSKCITGSNYPKQSEAVRNCNSFNSQLDNYVALLATVPPSDCNSGSLTCYDPENRAGELKSRTATIRHLYNQRMLPSVPANGWEFPKYEGYGGVLPLP